MRWIELYREIPLAALLQAIECTADAFLKVYERSRPTLGTLHRMTNVLGAAVLIGVDWGLTHLRAYCIGDGGSILDQRESSSGILSVPNRDFSTVLHGLIDDWVTAAPHLQIYLCGMIGSRNGWHEAPYSRCPASIRDVAERALTIDVSGRSACLVGGISFEDDAGRHDVIRGEETQLFGIAIDSGLQTIVTPGTHSKWVSVRDGTIERFRTYMTGELYSVLKEHSSLGWWTKEAHGAPKDEESFRSGVEASLQDPDLLHCLFTVRTRALFRNMPDAAHAAYLSGILIGNEVRNGLDCNRPEAVTLIGSANLLDLYRIALSIARVRHVECIGGDRAVARGLWRCWQCRTSR